MEGNIAYFRIGGDSFVYAYDSSNDKWLCIYPECPCIRFGIAVINGLLTTIGGQQDGKVIGSLLSLTGEGTNKQWSEKFYAMPTKRLFNSWYSAPSNNAHHSRRNQFRSGWRQSDQRGDNEY